MNKNVMDKFNRNVELIRKAGIEFSFDENKDEKEKEFIITAIANLIEDEKD